MKSSESESNRSQVISNKADGVLSVVPIHLEPSGTPQHGLHNLIFPR